MKFTVVVCSEHPHAAVPTTEVHKGHVGGGQLLKMHPDVYSIYRFDGEELVAQGHIRREVEEKRVLDWDNDTVLGVQFGIACVADVARWEYLAGHRAGKIDRLRRAPRYYQIVASVLSLIVIWQVFF